MNVFFGIPGKFPRNISIFWIFPGKKLQIFGFISQEISRENFTNLGVSGKYLGKLIKSSVFVNFPRKIILKPINIEMWEMILKSNVVPTYGSFDHL